MEGPKTFLGGPRSAAEWGSRNPKGVMFLDAVARALRPTFCVGPSGMTIYKHHSLFPVFRLFPSEGQQKRSKP
jgi:hypothetical protein